MSRGESRRGVRVVVAAHLTCKSMLSLNLDNGDNDDDDDDNMIMII